MLALLSRRIVGLAATLLAVSLLVFMVMNVLPGDPAAIMLGTSARPDTLAALRAELGLNEPAILRYLKWLGGLLRGDMGVSITYGVPVSTLLLQRIAVTIPLALLAVLLSVALAVPLGVLAAARQGRWTDRFVTAFAQLATTLPNFWLGLLLVLVFAVSLGWLPSGGFPGWEGGLRSGIGALVLPALALALPQAGILLRVTRAAVLDVMNEQFMRTARAKGLTRGAAIRRHALPNALVPVITIFGLQFSFLMAGSVLVENVFGLPGLGRLATQSFAQRDLVVLQAAALFLAGLVIVVNFLTDLAYLAVDPRLRERAEA